MASFLTKLFSKNTSILTPNKGTNLVRWEHGKIDSTSHKVDGLEKRFLVWTGKYKSIEEVPAFVSQSVVERARNRMRIKIANYMMLATAVGCVIMVYSGKQAAKRGESIQKENLEWHKQAKQESLAENKS